MRKYLQTTNIVDAKHSDVWTKINSANKVEEWHPLVEACYLKGRERVCVTEQGELHETILVQDSENFTFKYKIHKQKVYPTNNDIICTIKIIEGKTGTLMLWDIEFELEDKKLMIEMAEGFKDLSAAAARNLSN